MSSKECQQFYFINQSIQLALLCMRHLPEILRLNVEGHTAFAERIASKTTVERS